MKNYSIWKDGVNLKKYKKLDKDIDVDCLIIGGGITGISCLYHLKDSGLKVALVEQNKLGMGVTANTTGKITYLQDKVYNELLKTFDNDVASLYLKSQRDTINLILSIIKDNSIDCDLEKASSFVYTNKDSEVNKIEELRRFLIDNNIKLSKKKFKFVDNKCYVGVDDTYLFHPLKFIDGILKNNNFDIYEDTSIIKIEKSNNKYVCYTTNNKISAKRVIIASHYPYFNLPFLFLIKGSLEKSYVSASKKKIDNISFISYYKPVLSVRKYLDYMIYLEMSDNLVNNMKDRENYKLLEEELDKYKIKPEYLWSNIDVMSNDSLPYIGKIDDNMYIGTGYNAWGMTNGVLAGKVISDLILNRKNLYIELFNPSRVNIKMFGNAIIDGYYSALGYIKGGMLKDKNIEYKSIDGREVAIYKDKRGEHMVYTKCPHMGCRLNFNEVEKTWDCPCHASRFDIDGKVISAPSNRNISVDK